MAKLITNVVKHTYIFRVSDARGRKKKIEIEAESPDAAKLRLPEWVDMWWLIGEKE